MFDHFRATRLQTMLRQPLRVLSMESMENRSMERRLVFFSTLLTLVLFASCTAAPAADTTASNAAAEDAGSDDVSTVTTWYYFDQNNTDPLANERVGNLYMARAIEKFNQEFAGEYEWVNVPRDYNLSLDLVAAVQNNGEVPDVMRTIAANLSTFLRNNTIQDITDFVTSAPWYEDIEPAALEACTGPDGRIYCVPVSKSPYVVFYWTSLYPEGFPATPEALLERAETIQAQGSDALTYFGSTFLNGEAAGRYYYQVISSFGGSYDDGQGNMRLNTEANIAAVEFMREIVNQGYSSESVFVGNFEEEAAFKAGEAGAFPTGFFAAYLYLNPLTAPDGATYDTLSAEDMENAVASGDIALAPFVSPPNETPGCHIDYYVLVIPNGAPNVEGAKSYINWIMERENAIDWVLHAGGGLPTMDSIRSAEEFELPITQQARAAAGASDCRPWYGSLRDIPLAKQVIAETLFTLLKGNPTADIAEALAAAEEEYNSAQASR